ncbi:MAG: hypothetical protein RLZZ618_1277 [Pseudomonadota bacterium]|jgi:CBS-domain-containing membrane protein
MFSVYGITGRVFTGTLEQMREVTPVERMARARALAPVQRDPADSAYGTLADDANRAYTQTQQGDTRRHALTRVQEVMTDKVISVPHTATVMQGWRLLAQHAIGQAPVVDAQGALVGLLLRADLLPSPSTDPALWSAMLGQQVTSIMWTPVPGVAPDTDIRRVAQVLLDTGLPGLPVADEAGAVLGFISRSDILRAVAHDPPLDLWT